MVYNVQCTFIAFINVCELGPKMVLILPSYKESAQRIVHSGSISNLWNQMKEVFARKPEFLPNKIPDSCWLLSASGHLVSLSCSESLNWNYWLTRITEQRLILFQILKSYWNDFPLYNQELKIFECCDQIILISNQRNNCNVCLRLRKEIPVNSAKIQEFVQPLFCLFDFFDVWMQNVRGNSFVCFLFFDFFVLLQR